MNYLVLSGTVAGAAGAGTAWSDTAALIQPEPWVGDARCAEVDPDIFFPSKGEVPIADLARTVCGGCPVADECLSFALRTDQRYGIWGGLTTRQRRSLAKRSTS